VGLLATKNSGWVEALFSGLAFGGIILALWMQRHDLALQREILVLQQQELRDTRLVLDQEAAHLRDQARTMEQQRFETTLFNLLGLLTDTVGQTRVVVNSATKPAEEGVAAFRYLVNEIARVVQRKRESPPNPGQPLEYYTLSEASCVRDALRSYRTSSTLYAVSLLEAVVDVILNADLQDAERTLYARLVVSLLPPEFLFIFVAHQFEKSWVLQGETVLVKPPSRASQFVVSLLRERPVSIDNNVAATVLSEWLKRLEELDTSGRVSEP
jgi:hypothetical protein